MVITYFFEQYDTPMFQWQTVHMVNELAHHGITLDIVNPLKFNKHEDAWSYLLRRMKETKTVLFLTCHNEQLVPVGLIKKIKQMGIPTALICFDNLLIPFEHKKVCSYYDIVWITSSETEYMFKKWGAKTIFMPYAANPYAFKHTESQEINRAVFVGTPYGSRTNMINELTDSNIPVSIYGKTDHDNTKHVYTKGFRATLEDDLRFPIGRKLILAALKQRLLPSAILKKNASSLEINGFADGLSIVYSSYALSISSTSARNTGILKHPVDVINLRSFEIPMCGGIQFCKYNDELSRYFEEDKEIIFYRTHEEMIEKAKYYTSEKSLSCRKNIRIAARKRAEKDHTWYKRFQRLLKSLNIKV